MFGQVRFNSNPCDHGWSELIIHLTKKCDNKCPFCITNNDSDIGFVEPDVEKICKTINQYQYRVPYVIINGGEPMLYMDKLLQIVNYTKKNTNCKIYVFTALPKACIDNFELFLGIVNNIDGLIISAQHYNPEIADLIRNSKSHHNREWIYEHFPDYLKHKTTISLNIAKPYYKSKQDVLDNLEYFFKFGFFHFKLVEIKDNPDFFIDIPKFLGVKVKSPFAYKCSPEFPLSKFIPRALEGTVKLNLTCFLRNPQYKNASVWDLIKATFRPLFAKKGHLFGVVYEDGSIHPYWLAKKKNNYGNFK